MSMHKACPRRTKDRARVQRSWSYIGLHDSLTNIPLHFPCIARMELSYNLRQGGIKKDVPKTPMPYSVSSGGGTIDASYRCNLLHTIPGEWPTPHGDLTWPHLLYPPTKKKNWIALAKPTMMNSHACPKKTFLNVSKFDIFENDFFIVGSAVGRVCVAQLADIYCLWRELQFLHKYRHNLSRIIHTLTTRSVPIHWYRNMDNLVGAVEGEIGMERVTFGSICFVLSTVCCTLRVILFSSASSTCCYYCWSLPSKGVKQKPSTKW